MADSDFNRPVYSGEMFQDQKPSPIEAIKPYLGKIIALIIVIAIIYGAYWFFVGSMQSVQVNISGADKLSLGEISGSISQNGKQLQQITRTSQSLSLKEGSYDIEVFADGFKPYYDTISVSPEEKSVKIELEKDIEVKIDRIELKLNDGQGKIFAGKENEATVYLSNSGSSDVDDVEIVKESPDDKTLTLSLENSIISIQRGQQNVPAGIKLSVPVSYKVKDRTNGDSFELKLRVKGVKKNQAVKQVFIVPKMTIKVSPTKLTIAEVKANGSPSTPIDISIKNDEAFDIQGKINFTVTIQDAGNNSKSEVQKWFSFYPEITELKKKSIVKENMTVTVPLSTVNFPSENKPLLVLGTITAAGDSWSETINLNLNVSQITVSIKVPTLSASTFNLSQSSMPQTTDLSIVNDSELPLENVKVNVEPSCLGPFLTTTDSLEIPELSNNKTNAQNLKKIRFIVKLPADAPDLTNCKITVSYDDPLNPGGDPILIDTISLVKITRAG